MGDDNAHSHAASLFGRETFGKLSLVKDSVRRTPAVFLTIFLISTFRAVFFFQSAYGLSAEEHRPHEPRFWDLGWY
jgi:hypothetical protein